MPGLSGVFEARNCSFMKFRARCIARSVVFFFNDTATTEIYTLSLHDALPISHGCFGKQQGEKGSNNGAQFQSRSEEHTSELQSRLHLVCRLLLEKKKNQVEVAVMRCHRAAGVHLRTSDAGRQKRAAERADPEQ